MPRSPADPLLRMNSVCIMPKGKGFQICWDSFFRMRALIQSSEVERSPSSGIAAGEGKLTHF